MIVRELITVLGFRTELTGMIRYTGALAQLTARANNVAGSVGATVAVALAGIGALAAGGMVAIAKAGDASTATMNRLTTATGSVEAATAAYEGLYAIAQRTGVSVSEGARTFQRFAFAARDLGASNEDTLRVVQAIQEAAIISGSTTQEAVSASIQLGQALSSGVLQGEELRSLTENMPILAREMAKHLGIAYDQFRKMAKEGKFTSAVVFPALLKSAAEMDRLFDQMTPTMALSWERLNVVLQRIFSTIDKALGISQGVARALASITRTLESWRSSGGLQNLLYWLGSLGDMARLFGSAMIVAFGPAAVRLIMGVNAALLITVARFALLTAAFVMATLAVEDFWVWMQGGQSALGEKIGSFEEVKERVLDALDSLRDRAIEVFALAATSIAQFFSDIRQGAEDTVQSIIDAIMRIPAAIGQMVSDALNELRRLLPSLPFGNLLNRDPEDQERQRQRQRDRGGLPGFYNEPSVDPGGPDAVNPTWRDLIPRVYRDNWLQNPPVSPQGMMMGREPANITQRNTVNNELTINAPGADPASVAAAAQRGVNNANGFARENTDAFARQLGLAAPVAEAPSQ